jgi:plasmid stabilization system protein ParE
MYQLQVLRKAREDMQKSANWYDERQPGVGDRFLSEVVNTFRLIETNPLHYQERFLKKFRFAVVHGFPFVVVFKIKKQLVVVNSVFHTSRNPKRFI